MIACDVQQIVSIPGRFNMGINRFVYFDNGHLANSRGFFFYGATMTEEFPANCVIILGLKFVKI